MSFLKGEQGRSNGSAIHAGEIQRALKPCNSVLRCHCSIGRNKSQLDLLCLFQVPLLEALDNFIQKMWCHCSQSHHAADGTYNKGRKQKATGTGQDVRYWTLAELRGTFSPIGPVAISADGFLTINPQTADLDLLPPRSRLVVRTSDALRRVSTYVPPLVHVADSVVVHARKPA